MALRWESVLKYFTKELGSYGFSIVEPFAVGTYNKALPAGVGAAIPTQSQHGDNSFAIMIGNTKELWPVFLEACRKNKDLLQSPDPLDTFVEGAISKAIETIAAESPCRTYWAHKPTTDLVGGGAFVAMQRLAEAIGVAYLDSVSHLCLHPKCGPWFSLRAVLVFDGIDFTGTCKPVLQNPLDVKTQQYLRLVVMSAKNSSSGKLLAKTGDDVPPTPEAIKDRWEKWVAVRDAPFPGHPRRFYKDQIEYHYTQDATVLERAVNTTQSTVRILNKLPSTKQPAWVVVSTC